MCRFRMSRFEALCGDEHGMEGSCTYFCYPELILDGLVVILDSISVRTALNRHVSCGMGCGARAYEDRDALICEHL